MHVLVSQFTETGKNAHGEDQEESSDDASASPGIELSEERATLLYLIDIYNKNLFEIQSHPVRRVREQLDEFAREIVQADPLRLVKVLFRFRQFIGTYRIEEYSYVQKTFDDFRGIVWDFVDQLAEDIAYEQGVDTSIQVSLDKLKEAVESNSIHTLKTQSRQFIDSYMEHQSKRDQRKNRRVEAIKKNLDLVKRELTEANNTMRQDHLTGAYNRKSFDEQIKNTRNMSEVYGKNACLLMCDIDHFKSINDRFGHANGDIVIQECVKMLQETFNREVDFVARVGGEEFAVILPDFSEESAVVKAEQAHERIRKEALVKDDVTIKFTISIGVAQLYPGESVDAWMKRADAALYFSKNNGRNRTTPSSKLGPRRETA